MSVVPAIRNASGVASMGLLLLLCGCRLGPAASFTDAGFRHRTYDYSIAYAAPAQKEVLGPDFRLDNFYTRHGRLESKRGADYESRLYVDTDGDGRADDLGVHSTYDLRFEHKSNSAVIWLRTVPIDASLQTKELRVLMRSFLDAMAGTHYETVQLRGQLVRVGQSRTFAIEELASSEGTVARQPAFQTTLHVVNVDQLEVAPGKRQDKVQLVLIKTPFQLVERVGEDVAYTLPVLMLAGYAAHVDDFDASLPAFRGLLDRLTIAGRSGLALPEATAPQ